MRRLLFSIGLATVTAFSLSARAENHRPDIGVPASTYVGGAPSVSLGEASDVFFCFYECKPGPTVRDVDTWQEVTTLMLVNANAEFNTFADMVFLDGNQTIIAAADTALSPADLDEINVCRTLQNIGVPVPSAGLVEVVFSGGGFLSGGGTGGYGWVKNLLGKFFVNVDEPFDGRVTGIAKTQCRAIPPSVATPAQISAKFVASGVPIRGKILIEGTAP